MSTIQAKDVQPGQVLMIAGLTYTVIENTYQKPGKGYATSKLDLQSTLTGALTKMTFLSEFLLDLVS